jgi:hypothetical protein
MLSIIIATGFRLGISKEKMFKIDWFHRIGRKPHSPHADLLPLFPIQEILNLYPKLQVISFLKLQKSSEDLEASPKLSLGHLRQLRGLMKKSLKLISKMLEREWWFSNRRWLATQKRFQWALYKTCSCIDLRQTSYSSVLADVYAFCLTPSMSTHSTENSNSKIGLRYSISWPLFTNTSTCWMK